jgi:hypothetical protein
MLWLLLAATVVGSDTAASAPLTRSVALHVYTKKLVAVEDLKADELSLTEAGKPRKVIAVEPDRRPLEVAIVVDSAVAVKSVYRSDLVPAVVQFMKLLPPETRVALWSTAPAKIADFGSEAAAAENKLRMIAAAGGNYGFDSMVDACKELGARGAARRVIVYVGAGNLQASRSLTSALMEAIGRNRVVPMIVFLLPSERGGLTRGPSADALQAWDVQGYFEQMRKAYYGTYVEALSSLAVAQWLRQAAADISSQYRVRYESEAGPAAELRVEVRRKDTKFRVGRSSVVEVVASN